MTDPTAPVSDAPGRGLWVGLALGIPLMAWGARGALAAAARVHPAELARWIVGAALVHDLVVLPVTLALGLALRRIVPAVAWPPVRWALAASAVVTAVAWPFVRGYGRTPSVPSLLDRPYGSGLLTLLGLIWLAAPIWIAIRIARRGARASS
jgi:hypothetical protein